MAYLNSILTEFDPSITSELNLDPLGALVIWSAYGQAIFRNRISSISNDVRNYTLNLFNHWVTKTLVEDDEVSLGKGLQQKKAYAGRGKDSLAFKQACLIYLENLFVYSVVAAQNHSGIESAGVLGISKARSRWGAANDNPRLIFSHEDDAHVLVRQNSLGVSGRYKTPLVQMKFFDAGYDYALPQAQRVWLEFGKLVEGTKPLARLQTLVHAHLRGLLVESGREPGRQFDEVPGELKRAFVSAFSSPAAVGTYARDFWLTMTELDQGAPGALYEVLNKEFRHLNAKAEQSTAEVFALAIGRRSLAPEDRGKLEHVRLLEPFLGELELLLNVMLSAPTQSLTDVIAHWERLGRDGTTLPGLADPIRGNVAMRQQVSGTGVERLNKLLELAQGAEVGRQVEQLLKYHEHIMTARGQSPWLRLQNGSQLKSDVRTRVLPKKEDRPVGTWVNQYYIPQFRHFLSGLRGVA